MLKRLLIFCFGCQSLVPVAMAVVLLPLLVHQGHAQSTTADTSVPSALVAPAEPTDQTPVTDLHVQSVSRHTVQVSFTNRSNRSIFVRIYDVIGNLLRQEKVNRKGVFTRQYDLSKTRTDFYVVEIGNKQASITRRVFPM